MREKQIKTTIYYTPTRMAKIVKLKLVNIDKDTHLNSSWLLKLPRQLSGKESTCQCRRCRRCGFDPWVGKMPWRRKWQPTPVFWAAESHGQRSWVGHSPWGGKESDTTEHYHHTVCDRSINWHKHFGMFGNNY